MQNSETIKNGGSAAAAPADPLAGLDFPAPAEETDTTAEITSAPATNPLNDYLATQKEIFGYDEVYLVSTSGAIAAASDGKKRQPL